MVFGSINMDLVVYSDAKPNDGETVIGNSFETFLGGKGSNLSEMGRMGLPVPPGFTISTKVC